MDCINNSHSTPSSIYFDSSILFVTFMTTVSLLNGLLMAVLLMDAKLLKRTFAWFIFFQCFVDVLTLIIRAIYSYHVDHSNDLIATFIFLTFFEILMNSTIWMTSYRSLLQKRKTASMMTDTDRLPNTKLKALRSNLKVFVPLWLTVALASIILPTGSCQLIQQIYITGYPPVGEKWNYFLILSNGLVSYVPMVIFLICASLTILQLHQFKSQYCKVFRENALLQARFIRRSQTAIILSCYVVSFMIFVFPLQIYRFYLFFHIETPVEDRWHNILNKLSYLYFTANPCLLFLLCADLRKPLVVVKEKAVKFLKTAFADVV